MSEIRTASSTSCACDEEPLLAACEARGIALERDLARESGVQSRFRCTATRRLPQTALFHLCDQFRGAHRFACVSQDRGCGVQGAYALGLAKIETDGSVQASARVSTASALLKFGRESIELDDLASRIETLERTEHRKTREIWDD